MSEPIVFIIDDDPSARRGLTRLIGAAGMNVESFASALDFLAAGRSATKNKFSVNCAKENVSFAVNPELAKLDLSSSF